MKLIWNTIQLAFAAVGGFVGWFLGGCDGLLYTLLAFVVIDYLTGVMCAILDRVVTRADDAEQLGNLYFRLSGVYRQLENCTDAAEHDALEADKAVILAEIGTYVGYLNGYED